MSRYELYDYMRENYISMKELNRKVPDWKQLSREEQDAKADALLRKMKDGDWFTEEFIGKKVNVDDLVWGFTLEGNTLVWVFSNYFQYGKIGPEYQCRVHLQGNRISRFGPMMMNRNGKLVSDLEPKAANAYIPFVRALRLITE